MQNIVLYFFAFDNKDTMKLISYLLKKSSLHLIYNMNVFDLVLLYRRSVENYCNSIAGELTREISVAGQLYIWQHLR